MLFSHNNSWDKVEEFFCSKDLGECFVTKQLKEHMHEFNRTTVAMYIKGLARNGYIQRVSHGKYKIVRIMDSDLYLSISTFTVQNKYGNSKKPVIDLSPEIKQPMENIPNTIKRLTKKLYDLKGVLDANLLTSLTSDVAIIKYLLYGK